MKIKIIIAALIACLVAAGCSQQSNTKLPAEVKELLPAKSQVDSVSYLLGIQFAATAKNWGFDTRYNYSELVKGFKDFMNAKGSVQDPAFVDQFKINPELMQDLFDGYLKKLSSYEAAKGDIEAEAFLSENRWKDDVEVTESGLQYIILEKGSDIHPEADDEVEVHYVGKFINGEIFDESPEGESVTLPLDGVIPGWAEGIQLIGEGGKIRLFIPSELAYGASGSGPIGPNQALIFDVELVKIVQE